MPTVLFDDGCHRCLAFSDLVPGDDGIQANQILVQHGDQSALLDPGGPLVYNPLTMHMAQYVQPQAINMVLCSHQDPDIIGTVDKWLMYTDAKIICSKLWGRFVPHIVPNYMKNSGSDRYLLIPDKGCNISFGDSMFKALPAHFIHSVGNFSFYDPVSRILFSGDIGSSLIKTGEPYLFVDDFQTHSNKMRGFHQRYICGNKPLALWVKMVRSLNPSMIVPQHGLPFKDQAMSDFLAWLEHLPCGIDLLSQEDFPLQS